MNSSKQKPAQEHAMTVASGVIGNIAVPALAFFAEKAPSIAAGIVLAATVTQLALAGYEWHAHHIDGNWQYNALANCAVVCINAPENCHLKVAHGGNFRTGPLATPRSFVLNR